MKKVLCLIAALTLALSSLGCTKIRARMEIKAANEAYQKEDYAGALPHYQNARKIDPSFPDLDRLVGYSEIGLYVPDDKSPKNEQHADRAILQHPTQQSYRLGRPIGLPPLLRERKPLSRCAGGFGGRRRTDPLPSRSLRHVCGQSRLPARNDHLAAVRLARRSPRS